MRETTDDDFQQRMGQIDELVEQIEKSHDRAARDAAQDVIRLLLDLHAAGLARMIELLPNDIDERQKILGHWTNDELISSLLLLHNQHPDDVETRIRRAFDNVLPSLHKRGGEAELLDVSDDNVRLKLTGGGGCGSTRAALHEMLEAAIMLAAPEISSVVIEEPEPPPALVQLEVHRKAVEV